MKRPKIAALWQLRNILARKLLIDRTPLVDNAVHRRNALEPRA
jgi:hypothetical protein